ncbi:SPOR domain-containing protein [Paracoccus sp. PARArs4]|uniref:SPOR domain-containing protein n=1 Tax=Paracoccus sp. PARArs4 TaxID=2853442 RepID=UPI0024A6D354|nr:SPOR domain-containing protein [Paracoccus sp. PARArs4]
MAVWRYGSIWLCLVGVASAAPTPPPPAGFAGDQYIDAQGCVFQRADTGWTARLDGAGTALCGFPPSIAATRVAAPEPDAEAVLVEKLTEGLRPEEFAAGPKPTEQRLPPAPARHPDPLQTAIAGAVAIDPVLRQKAGLSGPQDLCARMGYRPDPDAVVGLGLCPGMSVPKPVAATPEPAPAPSPAVRPKRPAPPKQATPEPPAARPRPPGDLIAAGARYVQVGAFEDAGADAALRRIAAQGHPTAQIRPNGDKGPRIVLAGPFADRASLAAALAALRSAGFAGAVAR